MQDIDHNGSFVQRRKMYIGLPLHNMRSKLKFDWQGPDLSVQDQVGKRFRLRQENEVIKRIYNDRLDQRIHRRYVQHEESLPPIPQATQGQLAPQKVPEDTLARELEYFNSSKMATIPVHEKPQEEAPDAPPSLLQSRADKYNRTNDRLSHSYHHTEQPPQQQLLPRARGQSFHEPEAYYEPEVGREHNHSPGHRYDRPYYPNQNQNPNPENYYTLSPPPLPDRYRPYQPEMHASYAAPSKYVPQVYGGVPGSDYPFRNIMPDKLENHLREDTKADRKAVRVSLNLFDYKRP